MLFEEPAGKQPQKLFIVDHKCEWMRCFVHHPQRTHLLFSVVERLFSWLGLLRTLFVIVLDGSKEPNGESGIVHSLKANLPMHVLPYSEANLRVFASLRDRPDDLQALTPRCLVYSARRYDQLRGFC
jgi:hypothetical protein